MNALALLVLATAAVLYGLVSERLRATPLTAPMVMVGVGVLVSGQALGVLHLDIEPSVMHLVAELTLVFLLFADASRIDLRALRAEPALPVRMLAIGMPLTILLGVGLGKLILPDWPLAAILVLVAVLTPTDAALGQAVVEDKRLPARLRRALGVESGLNDGIAVPVVMVGIAVASMRAGPDAGPWVKFALLQVTLGPLIGITVGYVGGKLVEAAEAREWVSEAWAAILGLAMAIVAFALAEEVGGNGFIGVFTAGIVIGNVAPKACMRVHSFVENEGQLLMFLVFVFLGCVYAVDVVGAATGTTLLFGVMALTVMRIVPVLLSLIGSGLSLGEKFIAGWFGPRGIASIVFAIVALESEHLEKRQEIFEISMLVVLLSVFAHGATAYPGVSLYARAAARNETKEST